MGKFTSSSPRIAPLPPPAPGRDSEEAKEAMRRQRLAEKRRRGRRATLLASVDEDQLGGTVRRPSTASAAQTTKTSLG